MDAKLSLVLAAVWVAVPATAFADCANDIGKVQHAIEHPREAGLDMVTSEKMKALVHDAAQEHKAGNETKCQELIDQAKLLGAVD